MGSMLITNVRFSYFYGFEPFTPRQSAQNPNPKPMFTCHGLMAPDHPDLPRVAAEIEAVGAAHTWKGGMTWDQVRAMCKGGDKLCLHRGDVTKAGKPEYAGLFFISANNKARFTIIDADRKILTAKDGRPYSGCMGNMIVDIYAQDNEWGKRINATITGAQFLRHNDAFGGGAAPAQADEFPMAAASADAAAPSAASDPLAGLV